MREGTTPLIRREDYSRAAVLDRHRRPELRPRSGQDAACINRMKLRSATRRRRQPLKLHGEELNLTRVLVNGEARRSATRRPARRTCPKATASCALATPSLMPRRSGQRMLIA